MEGQTIFGKMVQNFKNSLISNGHLIVKKKKSVCLNFKIEDKKIKYKKKN